MSERRLYSVSVELEMIVMASSRTEAEDVALQNASEELGNAMAYANECSTQAEVLAAGYDLHSLPWGDDGVTTIGEILERSNEKR